MLYKKAERRIDQILNYLDERKTTQVESNACWFTAETENEYGDIPPTDEELDWSEIESFPFYYGKEWTNHWFKSDISFDCDKESEYFIETKTETDTMIYINREPKGASNPFHSLFRLDSGTFSIMLEAWGGHYFPGYHPDEGGRVLTTVAVKKRSYPLTFSCPRILRKNPNTWELYYDVRVLRSLSKSLDPSSLQYMTIISTLHKSLIKMDFTSTDEDLEEQSIATRNEIKYLLDAKNGTIAPNIFSIGNAHLDHAWLWPIAETTRKAARTALNMTRYIAEYPEFIFCFTQPVQMLAVKEKYPSIYKKVLEAYKAGMWEPEGTSWVEPDCMLPSGESFVRQFMFGKRANKELYPDYNGDVFWVPDSFGYNGQLPQILKKCGMKYFITSKIGWNDTNPFPYDVFAWEGIDGTAVPAHMIIGAYEGTNNPEEISAIWGKVKHKDLQDTLIRSIGEGDGGGGTTLDDLELIKRERDLQGLPKNSWKNLHDSLEMLFSSAPIETLPKYKGELYLELHRGTYTTQSDIKKGNRTLEAKLHNAEGFLSYVFANEGMSKRCKEAKALIDKAWIILLTNQFHDILPGSCINKAMEEAKVKYNEAHIVLDRAISTLEDKNEEKRLYAFSPIIKQNKSKYAKAISISNDTIETPWARIKVNANGSISSLVAFDNDKEQREIVKSGKSLNMLTLSQDTTINWDAWDMEYDTIALRSPIFPEKKVIRVEKENAIIECEYKLSEVSRLKQKTIIYSDERRIDYETYVSWHESHKILRAEFQTAISSPYAEYSIPFGYVSRSTLENNSIERAQFESPAILWTRLADANTSCILASPHKYGYRIKDGEMSISLLRSPEAPDPNADKGEHSFSYSFFIEEGSSEGLKNAIDDGYGISYTPTALASKAEKPFEVEELSGKTILETVKVSEDEDGITLRFYEALGSSSSISIRSNIFDSIYESNMLEEDQIMLSKEESERIEFSPFSVRTFILKKSKLLS